MAQNTDEVLEVFEMLDKLETAGESEVVPEDNEAYREHFTEVCLTSYSSSQGLG